MENEDKEFLANLGKLAVGLLTLWFVAGSVYWGKAIEGTVVDAETRQPIPGAIVVVWYELNGGLHYDRVGTLYVDEAVTDDQGRYRLPGWGPRVAWSVVDSTDPHMLIYKYGYVEAGLDNWPDQIGDPFIKRWPPLGSVWHKKTVALTRYKGPPENYPEQVGAYGVLFNAGTMSETGTTCTWEKAPRYTAELLKLRQRHPDYPGSIPIEEELSASGRCENPKTFLKKHEHS